MNTLLFSLLVATATPAVSPATAVEPIITRSYLEDSRLDLVVANLEKERTIVSLTDLDGKNEFFRERISDHNGYRVSLNLKELPAGRYIVSVEKGDTVRRQVILKNDAGTMCSDWK